MRKFGRRAVSRAATLHLPKAFCAIAVLRLLQYLGFAGVLLPPLAFAQASQPLQKAQPDSGRQNIADTSRLAKSSPVDSVQRFMSRKSFVDSSAGVRFSPPHIGFLMDTAAESAHFFQDFIHLAGQTVPMVPIVAGEVGQPRYWAAADLPPRAVRIVVDDIWWIPGVYGNVDLTSLPDAQVQILEAGSAFIRDASPMPSPYGVHVTSDSLNFNVPFSRIEYAKGPFGADAVRFQFGRALGKRLAVYLNSAFGNSDGQFAERPYDGHKASLQLDYFLSSRWKLRYRQLNSRNEAGIGVPFFPEEWPGITNASHKEERLYHAFELSSRQNLWLRGFLWQVKEELNDPARRNRHRLLEGGTELEWKKQTAAWALQLKVGLGLEAIKSTSIRARDRFYEKVSAALGRRLTQKTWLRFNTHFSDKTDWPSSAALQAQLIMQANSTLTWWLGGGIWKIAPALGERDNTLPYLATNSDLRAADLQCGEIGMKWRQRNLDLHFRLNGSLWKNGFVFQPNSSDSSGALVNSNRNKFVFAAQFDASWEFMPRWRLGAFAAQTINKLPRHFWFWHQPEGHNRVYLETLQSVFGGDLEILPRLAGRFVGKRYSPSFATNAVKPLEHELPAAAVLDFQIRLRHGDGAFLFSWENVLNQQFDWRYEVPAVGRYLRWGFWWNFLN